MSEIRYPIVIHRDPDGLTVEIPDFGFVTEGDTVKECKQMAQEAIDGCIEANINNGLPVPSPSQVRGKNVRHVSPDPRLQAGLLLRFSREDKRHS